MLGLKDVSEVMPLDFEVVVAIFVYCTEILNEVTGEYAEIDPYSGATTLSHYYKDNKLGYGQFVPSNAVSTIGLDRLYMHIQLCCQPYLLHNVLSGNHKGVKQWPRG